MHAPQLTAAPAGEAGTCVLAQFAQLESDKVKSASIVWLLQDGRYCQLLGVSHGAALPRCVSSIGSLTGTRAQVQDASAASNPAVSKQQSRDHLIDVTVSKHRLSLCY